jgi:hypothetical protein
MLRISGGSRPSSLRQSAWPRLVVSDDPPLLRVQPPRLLGADRLAQQRLVEVGAGHRLAARAAGDDRRLVEGVGELGAGHPRRLAGDVAKVEVGAERLALGMGAEDRLAAVAVGRRDQHLPVEAARPQQRPVELVDVVGGGDHDHGPLRPLEAVELDQQLVEGLLALAGAAVAAAIAARPSDRVELVDEDHRAAGLARLLEQAPDAGGSPPHEHLYEARARGREEVDAGLRGDRPRQHRLPRPGRAEQQHAARRLRAERGEAIGIAQPLGDVHQLVLGGVDPLHLLPEHRLGLARLDRLGLGGAHRPAQQRDEDDQQAEHEDDPEDRVPIEEEALYFAGGQRLDQVHVFLESTGSVRPNSSCSNRTYVRVGLLHQSSRLLTTPLCRARSARATRLRFCGRSSTPELLEEAPAYGS